MKTRKIADVEVAQIGLGCMSLSHAYGNPPAPEQAARVLERALEIGVTLFDTASLYGFGRNEELLGRTLRAHRSRLFLASKCGMTGVDGKRVIDGRPATLRRTCEESLQRLQTDVIDLYYLHRWDKQVPLEDSLGAMADMLREGKIRAVGLSEVSAATLRRAHAICPIAAVQNEYSLWSRNVELGVLDACREIGATLVAFSPVARGFLAGSVGDPSLFAERDIRRGMPRFQEPHFPANRELLTRYNALADEVGCSGAQLALAWLLAKAPCIVPIPGTTSIAHLEENVAASGVSLSPLQTGQLEQLINQQTVSGPRYPAATLAEIDTEEFP